jgi:DNA-binding protein Fis
MAIFDLNDFNYRRVIKLAPDAFITINGAFGGRVISPINKDTAQTIDIQGGVTTININSSINPPASGRATIQIIAPEYTGLHTRSTSNSSGYWITLPSGAKVPYFLPMQEVQVFMKGRFLYTDNNPVYYRTFWGFITDITEDYNSGITSLSLQCADMLTWWKYQKLTISPNEFTAVFTQGNVADNNFPTLFKWRNPWQIITQLLYETQMTSSDGSSTYNFVYPKISNTAMPPYMDNLPNKDIGVLALRMSEYWHNRFNFFGQNMQIEMFGLTHKIDNKGIDTIRATIEQGVDILSPKYNQMVDPDISWDYNLLARVQPFGDFNTYGMGAESVELTKLEIAQKVCEQAQMEFYVDLNGIIVFKPPFYNMDVTKGDIPYYVVDSKDVINYSSSLNTDNICTYLELTAPQLQQAPQVVELIGFHIDWEMMLRYGLRFQRNYCQYGNDSKSLSMLAAAEMTKINSEATNGHVSIPLRPEIRMGYPVYIVHKDVYFYISGISHSFNFGAAATTDLTLTAKRDRIYDYTGDLTKNLSMIPGVPGNISAPTSLGTEALPMGSGVGRVLRGFVQKFAPPTGSETDVIKALNADVDAIALADKNYADLGAISAENFNDPNFVKSTNAKENFLRVTQAKAGPQVAGLYQLVPAEVTAPISATVMNSPMSNASGPPSTIVSNQLLMITTNTIPYTDIKGYRHIGAFPYGANLVMRNHGFDSTGGSPKEESHEVATVMTTDPEQSSPTQNPSAVPELSAYTYPFSAIPPALPNCTSTRINVEAMTADPGGAQALRNVYLKNPTLPQ